MESLFYKNFARFERMLNILSEMNNSEQAYGYMYVRFSNGDYISIAKNPDYKVIYGKNGVDVFHKILKKVVDKHNEYIKGTFRKWDKEIIERIKNETSKVDLYYGPYNIISYE